MNEIITINPIGDSKEQYEASITTTKETTETYTLEYLNGEIEKLDRDIEEIQKSYVSKVDGLEEQKQKWEDIKVKIVPELNKKEAEVMQIQATAVVDM